MSFVVKYIAPERIEWLVETYPLGWVWSENIEERAVFETIEEAKVILKGNPRQFIIESTDNPPSRPAKFYRLSQGEYKGYDTFDSCIVVAHSEEEARLIHPRPGTKLGSGRHWQNRDNSWVALEQIDLIVVEELGIAYDHLQPGTVVMSSFNAG